MLDLESARGELRAARDRVDALLPAADEVQALRKELEQKDAAHAQAAEMQRGVEAVLKRQVRGEKNDGRSIEISV